MHRFQLSDKVESNNNFISINVDKLNISILAHNNIYVLDFIITSNYRDFSNNAKFGNIFNIIGI